MDNATAVAASASAENKPAGPIAARKLGPSPSSNVHERDWQDMIATAAYFRAEKRGFAGGSAEQDWYEAEAELRERFGRGGGI